MKKSAMRLLAMLLCICMVSVTAYGAEYLIPVGQVIGLELADANVTVAAFDDVLGTDTKKAGLCIGDRLLTIDGRTISCVQDVRQALQCGKETISVQISRKGRTQSLQLHPRQTADGPKLGIFLKQGVTGIGTVTFYDPDTGEKAIVNTEIPVSITVKE